MTSNDGHPQNKSMPLFGLKVVDLTNWLGGYTGRLLSDLGADVVHITTPGRRSPRDAADFVRHFGKTVKMNASSSVASGDIADLLNESTILITDVAPAILRQADLHPEQTTARWPGLIHVAITPYGLSGPHADTPASDLTLLAAGGLLYLCGDPDRPPVRPYGEQSAIVASLHATVATLIAVAAYDDDRCGQVVDVSAQEAVAHSLENAVQYFDCEGTIRRRRGAGPVEAGVGLFRARDGYVYLLASMGGKNLSWNALAAWLVDSGAAGAEELTSTEWSSTRFRRTPEAVDRFLEIFDSFGCMRSKNDICVEGQARGISLAPVLEPGDLLENAQLKSRQFFHTVDFDGVEVQLPGLPYKFDTSDVGRFDLVTVNSSTVAGSTPAVAGAKS